MLTFSITFLVTLLRLATEKEVPQVNHSPSFYLRVNYANQLIYQSLYRKSGLLSAVINVRKSSGPYSVPITMLKIVRL